MPETHHRRRRAPRYHLDGVVELIDLDSGRLKVALVRAVSSAIGARRFGCPALPLCRMESPGATFTTNDIMAEVPFTQKRANRRFEFFADAEITLKDGTLVPSQLTDLSSGGCYLGTLEPIPIGAEFRLHISDSIRTCELQGKVIYLHSGSGLGIFGIGVLFGRMSAEHRSVIDAWLHELAGDHAASPSARLGP